MAIGRLGSDGRAWVPILANPTAGSGSRRALVGKLVRRLRQAGFDPEVFWERESFREKLGKKEGAGKKARCLVAAGGDGTFHWLINHTAGIPVAVFPLGSENLLARHFGIGPDPERLVTLARDGATRRIDLGVVNGERFALMTSAGLDAAVVERAHRSRRGHITRWSYVAAILASLWWDPWPAIQVYLDEDTEPIVGHHVFVFNCPQYALDLPVCPAASPLDGRLDVVILRGGGLMRVWTYLRAMRSGRLGELHDIVCRKVTKVRLESAGAARVQADGDPLGPLPARIEVAPAALEVLVPVSAPPNVGSGRGRGEMIG